MHDKCTLLLIAKIWNETQKVCGFKCHTSPFIGSHGNRKVIAVVPMQIWPSSSRLLPWQSNPQEQLLCHQLEFDHGLLPRSYKFDNRTHTNQTHLVCCYKYHLPSNRSHGKHTHNNWTHTDLTHLVRSHGNQTHTVTAPEADLHSRSMQHSAVARQARQPCIRPLRDSRAYDHCSLGNALTPLTE